MGKKPSRVDEAFYQKWWEENKTHVWRPHSSEKSFVIDTPPPTVSGALHIGHLFSYTQTDIMARFQRMNGKNVFYPMGWDNNGLPTEKRVQKLHGIVCDPALKDSGRSNIPEDFKDKDSVLEGLIQSRGGRGQKHPVPVSRERFIAICRRQTAEDQKKYEALWRRLALSVDWSQRYETISDFSCKIAQRSFINLYRQSAVENRLLPVFWDTRFRTAVAQADMEDRELKGCYYDIVFQVQGGGSFPIATTRPELLPAAVAVVAHPEDSRWRHLFGKRAISPLFHAPVPILPALHADPEKGTGILMVCTFGDKEDLEFWQTHNASDHDIRLPLKPVITPGGCMKELVFSSDESDCNAGRGRGLYTGAGDENLFLSGEKRGANFFSLDAVRANKFYRLLSGLSVRQAHKKTVELLKGEGVLKEVKPCTHSVKFYEKGDLPLELILTRQWYIKILEHKEALLQRGREIVWHPPAMRKRYEQWVEGLNQDWCISRQRFYGVPFPVWYPLDSNRRPDYRHPVFAPPGESVDPMKNAPADFYSLYKAADGLKPGELETVKHYVEGERGKPGGFVADPDVMDTWAVSSMTPQINSHWGEDKERYKELFPADLRSQAHEIIRTWAFYTIVKSHFHANSIPWRHIAVSGWVMNPERLKLSKSKEKSFATPDSVMDEYGVDAVRYWAGKSRLGQDTIYDENGIKTGRRLTVKLLNAFRFVKIQVEGGTWQGPAYSKISHVVDKAWILFLHETHKRASRSLQNFEYAPALEEIEKTFWLFCDHYLELVKARAYRLKEEVAGRSAIHALDLSFYFFVKMFAPYFPYTTEAIWRERYMAGGAKNKSVHLSPWYFADQRAMDAIWLKDYSFHFKDLCEFIFKLLEQIRAGKTNSQKSVSAALRHLSVGLLPKKMSLWEGAMEDIARAANIEPGNIQVQVLRAGDMGEEACRVIKMEFADS